jgi:hypothetical protein
VTTLNVETIKKVWDAPGGWLIIVISVVAIGVYRFVSYFGHRRVNRASETTHIELTSKKIDAAAKLLAAEKEFGTNAVSHAMNTVSSHTDLLGKIHSLVANISSPTNKELQFLQILCIHAGSEADLAQLLEFVASAARDLVSTVAAMNTRLGSDLHEVSLTPELPNINDDPDFQKRRELAQMTFWQCHDILQRSNYDHGQWQLLIEELRKSVPDPRVK